MKSTFSQKSKTKKRSKTQLDEKTFHDALDHFVFLYFFNAWQAAFALHNKRQ